MQYDILTTVARGQTVGRRKGISGLVVGGGAGLDHLRERVERAAADHGFDVKTIAECLGGDCARVSRTGSRAGERRSALRVPAHGVARVQEGLNRRRRALVVDTRNATRDVLEGREKILKA